jgi:hypothetical protein
MPVCHLLAYQPQSALYTAVAYVHGPLLTQHAALLLGH